MKIISNISPNYSKKIRLKHEIKFIIIHYTGMQSEIESIQRLKNPKYKVSCHYLINRKGHIVQMVNDLNIAWHAGKSKWKEFSNLNSSSLGIELVNKGHEYGYQNFSNPQIKSLIRLCKILKKKYALKKENFLGHSDIAPLRKIDPGEKFPWEKLSNHNLGKWYKKYKSDIKFNLVNSESYFFKNLQKLGYRYFKANKRSYTDKKIIKCFQQRYLPDNVNGKIDQKTLQISHYLTH